MIVKLVNSMDALGHDRTLLTDKELLSGLFAECVRRRWFAERFSSVAPSATTEMCKLRLELRTLGRLEIRLEDRVVRVPLVKSAEILVWLALNGTATRDEIVRAVWGRGFERKHIEYFKVAARKLRSALSEHPGVTFNPLPFEHDTYRLSERFEISVDAAPLLNHDAPIGTSKPLEGYFLPGVESEWVEEARRIVLEKTVYEGNEHRVLS